LERLLASLAAHLEDRLRAVALYGSVARGEARPGSDLDLLVITDVRDAGVHDALIDVVLALRDAPERALLDAASLDPTPSFVVFGEAALAEHPWLLMDVATDGEILLDSNGLLRRHLDEVRARMRVYGTRRVHVPDGAWYWELKPGMRPGEEIRI